MRLSRYQSVIVASIGFAPQSLQKLWASENGPTHYLDSWVKIWAIPPMPLTSLFSKTVRNFELKFFVQSSYTWRHTWQKFRQNLWWSPADLWATWAGMTLYLKQKMHNELFFQCLQNSSAILYVRVGKTSSSTHRRRLKVHRHFSFLLNIKIIVLLLDFNAQGYAVTNYRTGSQENL